MNRQHARQLLSLAVAAMCDSHSDREVIDGLRAMADRLALRVERQRDNRDRLVKVARIGGDTDG